MIWTLFQVALGGAIGASLRHLAGLAVFRIWGPSHFPITTLGVNVLGSFLMGLVVIYAAHRGATHLSPFLMTGILGGFTTFSAFSLDVLTLYERGAGTVAMAYVAASVILSVAAIFAAVALARVIWA